MTDKNRAITLTGGAGLVGQNLCAKLLERGYNNLTVFDKNQFNLAILQKMHPAIRCFEVDLAEPGVWQQKVKSASQVIMLQAQIGAKEYEPFQRNNILATENVLAAINPESCHLVHVSSSVINSVADDFYTRSKTEQENIVLDSGIEYCILRPTLMFGWFDRKHFGWLSRFMKKTPVFPIPGDGKYLRQPLFVGDFCDIIVSSMEKRISNKTYDITGREKLTYIDIIKTIKKTIKSRTILLPIPYRLFDILLRIYGIFDKSPPLPLRN
ncbi:NAD(P)-dependent oxidoreductase [Oceanicoccus sp. KOV_DT_Chl]|uniref:NAD-dependent epimerase/dehydratase family protein n=1 Tax=Oceanicoccus sp. KOV_DT_Chl TaxID=1904639 RepID=UPI00190E63A1|nr:NAD-dependent epimerase/dehydratase family protein [Oceanicoccus sp. KOV_DT_Chl]